MDIVEKKHTDKTGDISEAHILARLLKTGYTVLQPFGKNHRYDLVIEDNDGNFYRVQCKTGWLDRDESVITFAAASSYNHTAKTKGWRTYKGQIDYFAVYVEALNEVYLVPIDDTGEVTGKLRLKSTKNNQKKGVKWAKDYVARECSRRDSNPEPPH